MFGLDRLLGQAIVAGLVLLGLGLGVVWYGSVRYEAGVAAEAEHWREVIRQTNATIDDLNRRADEAKSERDQAVEDLKAAAGKVEIVAVPVEIARRCDMPEAARLALNAINIKRGPP